MAILAGNQPRRPPSWLRRHGGPAVTAFGVAVGALAACHTVFDGELGAFACSDEGAVGPPACPPGKTCLSGACVILGRPLGGACSADADCQADAKCYDPADFGVPGTPLCTRLCCAATDCGPADAALVCWPPPEGTGSLCWPASALARPAPGTAPAGAPCTTDGDCRSAVCEQDRCLDHCCDDSYCEALGDVCRVMASSLADQDTWVCAPPPSAANADFCTSGDDCRSGTCLTVTDDVRICAQPCCSSRQCGTVYLGTSFEPLACAPTLDGSLRACSQLLTEAATRNVGDICLEDGQCRSGFCYIDGGDEPYCSDSCCSDESCGDTSAFACLPVEADGTWALRCVRK